MNLIRNAVYAINSASVIKDKCIIIRTSLDKRFIYVSVQDNDPGLPENISGAEIFNPFFTTKKDGIGMGLAICRTIIRLHGGSLSINPNKTDGTELYFTLPANL